MKKIIFIIAPLLVFCFMTEWVVAKPAAVIDSPVFVFEAVPEGTRLDHEFIIRNTGDTQLIIEKVLPP